MFPVILHIAHQQANGRTGNGSATLASCVICVTPLSQTVYFLSRKGKTRMTQS